MMGIKFIDQNNFLKEGLLTSSKKGRKETLDLKAFSIFVEEVMFFSSFMLIAIFLLF